MNDIGFMIIGAYLILHTPAIIMLIVGLYKLKTKPNIGKNLIIAAVIYFLIGAGICGVLLNGGI